MEILEARQFKLTHGNEDAVLIELGRLEDNLWTQHGISWTPPPPQGRVMRDGSLEVFVKIPKHIQKDVGIKKYSHIVPRGEWHRFDPSKL